MLWLSMRFTYRFCFCALASLTLVRKVFWDGILTECGGVMGGDGERGDPGIAVTDDARGRAVAQAGTWAVARGRTCWKLALGVDRVAAAEQVYRQATAKFPSRLPGCRSTRGLNFGPGWNADPNFNARLWARPHWVRKARPSFCAAREGTKSSNAVRVWTRQDKLFGLANLTNCAYFWSKRMHACGGHTWAPNRAACPAEAGEHLQAGLQDRQRIAAQHTRLRPAAKRLERSYHFEREY